MRQGSLAARGRRRRIRAIRRHKLARGCGHHLRSDIVALHDEPKGTNPPKLIGYVCTGCMLILTAASTPSLPTIPSFHGAAGTIRRINHAHAARLRAIDRLGLAVAAEEPRAA
jgi:hypothetical protein